MQTLCLDLHLLALESCKYVDPIIGLKVYLCLMDMPKELVAFVIPSTSTLPELSHRGISWRNEWLSSQIVQYVHKNLAKSVTERSCANWSHFKLLLKWYPFSSCSRLGVKLIKMMQIKCPIKFIRNSASCDGFIQKIHPGWSRIHYSTN